MGANQQFPGPGWTFPLRTVVLQAHFERDVPIFRILLAHYPEDAKDTVVTKGVLQ